METYIARQPIFNTKKQIYGYELLYRNAASDTKFDGSGADQATSQVIMESFYSRGVESITGGRPAFINFTANLLLENTPTIFPKEHLVVEVLEDVNPTPEIIDACRSLQETGYKLALDDFVYRPELDPLIEVSRIIKVDFLVNTPKDINLMLKRADLKGKWLLAEKIETTEMFTTALSLGFHLFQGYFFSKPETLTAKVLSPMKISYISLMREICSGDDMSFNRVARVIRGDLALSYKLLRLVNSAYYDLRAEVTDINRAVSIIGTVELRKWVFLIALMGLNTGKPDEIIKMSMIRGRFIEEMNAKCRFVKSVESAFQVGLFSMLDVLMEMPMGVVIDGMNLASDVVTALVYNSGPLFDALELVISLEQSNWDKTDLLASELCIGADMITDVYLEAVKWCNNLAF